MKKIEKIEKVDYILEQTQEEKNEIFRNKINELVRKSNEKN